MGLAEEIESQEMCFEFWQSKRVKTGCFCEKRGVS